MAQLICFFPLFLAGSVVSASSALPKLEAVARATVPAKFSFQKTVVGGLSGVVFHDGELLLVSDDRGKIDPPRFYRANLKIQPPLATLTFKSVHPLKKVPGLGDGSAVLDPEGLAVLDGDILITSEADTNRKPREKNRLMRFDASGVFLDEGAFPSAYQPNPTGLQTRGSPNNAGPEGLSVCSDGMVWTAQERPLRQEEDSRQIRLLPWRKKGGKLSPLASTEERTYQLEAPAEGSGELFRGVSEILCWDDKSFLVLERTLQLQTKKPLRLYGGTLYFANCTKAACVKTALLDLSKDLTKILGRAAPNFEGLSFGPPLADGSKTVLMVSDDNFDSSDGTELIVLRVVPPSPEVTEKK